MPNLKAVVERPCQPKEGSLLILCRLSNSQDKQLQTPAVLDFASDSNPGGGFRGSQQGTQEEELCRQSNLGVCLEALYDRVGGARYHTADGEVSEVGVGVTICDNKTAVHVRQRIQRNGNSRKAIPVPC